MRYPVGVTTYEHVRLFIWVFGVPTILALSVRAARRVREIRKRHVELLEDAKKTHQDPYAQLSQLYDTPRKR